MPSNKSLSISPSSFDPRKMYVSLCCVEEPERMRVEIGMGIFPYFPDDGGDKGFKNLNDDESFRRIGQGGPSGKAAYEARLAKLQEPE